ncbi:hypothetical protein V3589_25365 [Sinorhizobium fredii]|uniref:hypothetical protein n=1 Tax=Rhizobium fredii TaxID=380 RepID=UPI00309E3A83
MTTINKSMLGAIAANDDLPPIPDYVQALSFMDLRQPRGSGVKFWNVEPTGVYGEDCLRGKECARELLDYVAAHPTNGNMYLLSWIVCDMASRGVDHRGEPVLKGAHDRLHE